MNTYKTWKGSGKMLLTVDKSKLSISIFFDS